MQELAIRAANEPKTPEDDPQFRRPMGLIERLRFIALFIAAALLAVIAAIIVFPLALIGVIRGCWRRGDD